MPKSCSLSAAALSDAHTISHCVQTNRLLILEECDRTKTANIRQEKVFRKLHGRKVAVRTVECGTLGRIQPGMPRFIESLAVNHYRHFRCGKTRNVHKVLVKKKTLNLSYKEEQLTIK